MAKKTLEDEINESLTSSNVGEPEVHIDPETYSNSNEQSDDSEDIKHESDTEEELEEEEETKVEPVKHKGGFAKRLNRANKERDRLREEVEYWQNQALLSKSSDPSDDEPKESDYKDTPSYAKDLAIYHARKAIKEDKLNQTKSIEERKKKEVLDRWNDNVNDFMEEKPDFHERMADVKDIEYHPSIHNELLESDHGPEIAYHIASNKKLAMELSNMSLKDAIKRIHKLEALIENSRSIPTEDHKPVQKSNAPTPTKPLKTITGKSSKKIEDMSVKEFEQWRKDGGDIKLN